MSDAGRYVLRFCGQLPRAIATKANRVEAAETRARLCCGYNKDCDEQGSGRASDKAEVRTVMSPD